jgi:transposase
LPEPAGAADPEPTWHQVVDLPRRPIDVTEHRGHARTCAGCGHVTRAAIPAAVRADGFAPRFRAFVGTLTGVYHLSKREAAGLIQTVLGVPIAVGTVAAIERELSAALAGPHAEAAVAARAAPVKNIDETSWKLGGQLAWLWTAVTATCSYFLIHPRRSAAAFAAVVGPALRGIAITDRWVVYDRLPAGQRQLCWAHLVRDFQAVYETTGPGRPIGNAPGCARGWTRGPRAAAPRRRRCAATCGRGSRRCGRSRGSRGWSRRTTRPSGRCGGRSCGASGASGARARRAAGSWSGC